MPAHHEAQDGLQQDQNGKSFIYFNVILFSLGVGNNQCYLLVVLPGATSGLLLVVRKHYYIKLLRALGRMMNCEDKSISQLYW